MNKDLEKEIEDFAYTVPHSSTGFGPNLKHYEDTSVKEARENGWVHSWSFDNVMKIVNKAVELTTEKAKNWIQDEIIEDYKTIIWEGAIDDFTNHMKN